MKPLKLNFTTFLKISTKTTRGKIGDIRRFRGKGGYDFYKTMKQIGADLAKGTFPLQKAQDQIAQITNLAEQKHTLAAITQLDIWLKNNRGQWEDPPHDLFTSDSGMLKIQLKPDLGFKDANKKLHAIYLWNLASPEMKSELAGEGLWLTVEKLGKPTNEFEILDLRSNKLFTEKSINPNSGLQLKRDLMLIEEIWKDINTPSMSAEDTLAHISSLTLNP